MTALRRVTAFVLVAAALAVTPACTRRSTFGAAHNALVIGIQVEPQSLDPLLIEGASTALIMPTLFSGLVTVDDRGNVLPDLATAVPSLANGGISKDGLTIVYRLRPGVRWQDGAPLTAADVAFTYSAIMNPRNNVQSRFGYDQVQSVNAIGDSTIRVRLKHRYSPIITTFFGPDQNYPVLPKHILQRYGDVNQIPFNTAPVGSGPYRAGTWTRGDRLSLTANSSYFLGAAHIPRITLKFIPDNSTLLQQLRTHEVDATFAADPAYLNQYQALPGMTVTRTPITGTATLYFNTGDPSMHDVRVRRAIVEALDIPRLVHDATRGGETSQNASAALFTWAYDPSAVLPSQNVAGAIALLDAAGWVRGAEGLRRRNGTPLVLHFVMPNGDAEGQQVGLAIQQQLRTLGISVTLRAYSPVQFLAPAASGGPVFGGRFQMAFVQILTDVDPNGLPYFGCDQVPPNGFNIARFCDPAIQSAYEADSQTYDRAARLRYLSTVQHRLVQTLPIVPLWRRRSISVYPQWLSGVKPSPITPYWNIADWSLHG